MAHIIPNYADSSFYPDYKAELEAFVSLPNYKEIQPHITFKEYMFFKLRGLKPMDLVKWREEHSVVLMKINLETL